MIILFSLSLILHGKVGRCYKKLIKIFRCNLISQESVFRKIYSIIILVTLITLEAILIMILYIYLERIAIVNNIKKFMRL